MKHVLAVLIALLAVSPAHGSTGASSIIAAQLVAEGDRLSADRANLDEALARYDRAIALEEPSARRLFRRSELRLAAGDRRGAISDLTWALARQDADREAVLALRCRAKRLVGDRVGALADCREAQRLNAGDPIANGERAEIELVIGNFGSAWQFATTAREMDSQTTRYDALRCRIAGQMQSQEKMAQSCPRARQIGVDER